MEDIVDVLQGGHLSCKLDLVDAVNAYVAQIGNAGKGSWHICDVKIRVRVQAIIFTDGRPRVGLAGHGIASADNMLMDRTLFIKNLHGDIDSQCNYSCGLYR